VFKYHYGIAILCLGLLTSCGAGPGSPGDFSVRVEVQSDRAFASCTGGDCDDTVCVVREFRECAFDLTTLTASIDTDSDDQSDPTGNQFEFTLQTEEQICMRVVARPSSATATAAIGGSFSVEKACGP